MSKRSLKPISKENLKQVIGGGSLPATPADTDLPRGGWVVPPPSPDGPHNSW